jgi:hypothetical protein
VVERTVEGPHERTRLRAAYAAASAATVDLAPATRRLVHAGGDADDGAGDAGGQR